MTFLPVPSDQPWTCCAVSVLCTTSSYLLPTAPPRAISFQLRLHSPIFCFRALEFCRTGRSVREYNYVIVLLSQLRISTKPSTLAYVNKLKTNRIAGRAAFNIGAQYRIRYQEDTAIQPRCRPEIEYFRLCPASRITTETHRVVRRLLHPHKSMKLQGPSPYDMHLRCQSDLLSTTRTAMVASQGYNANALSRAPDLCP